MFRSLGLSEEQWKTYRKSIKDYRDKDLAHIEVWPVSQVPYMNVALQAAAYYYTYVHNELLGFSNDYNAWPEDLSDYYQASLVQTKPIVALAYKATSHIREKVR